MGVETHPIPTAPGLATAYVGQDVEVGEATGTVTVTGFFLSRAYFAVAGEVTAELRNPGGDSIPITLGAGVESGRASGSIDFTVGEKVLLRVTAADAASMSLGGSFDLIGEAMGVATYLTTLPLVRSFLGLTDTAGDSLISDELIPGISRMMEKWMGREIVLQSNVTELHDVCGGVTDLPFQQYPITTVAEVRVGGTVIDSSGYKLVHANRMLRRVDAYWGTGEVEIDTTDVGYSVIPPDLQAAATAEVAHAFRQSGKGGGRLGMGSGSVPGQSDASFIGWDWLPFTLNAMRNERRHV